MVLGHVEATSNDFPFCSLIEERDYLKTELEQALDHDSETCRWGTESVGTLLLCIAAKEASMNAMQDDLAAAKDTVRALSAQLLKESAERYTAM
jgi:hypothetical protein